MPQALTKTEAKDQHIAEVAQLTTLLVDTSLEASSHRVILEALIAAYTAVAVCHPCCQQYAASLARDMASLIETKAAPQPAPPIH